MVFMMFYQRWKALQEKQQSGEDATVTTPENRLLFATDLPFLRKTLLPILFPRLQDGPAVDATDAWGGCLHVLPHGDWVRGCCFSPDGRLVASVSDEMYVRLWDARTGNLQHIFVGFLEWPRGIVMTPASAPKDGLNHVLLAAFDIGIIKVWNATTGKLLTTLSSEERGEMLHSSVLSIALSPTADELAAAVNDTVIIWELPHATSYREFGRGRAHV